MNSNLGESSSSMPDPDNDEEFVEHLKNIDEQEEIVLRIRKNNIRRRARLLENQMDDAPRWGSIVGRLVVERDREAADQRLWNDYFSANLRFDERKFCRRYRMSRNLFNVFMHILQAVQSHDEYFVQKRDGLGRLGLSPFQKITAAMKMLAYAMPADATDEYVKIGESTCLESLQRFCRAVVEVFSPRYLRAPNADDIARLLYIGQQRGFPGMLGSLDCMHWKWKNCPTAWAGQYTGRSGSPTIILEAVADYDLWIWHAHFGLPGSNNDINVLDSSHLFSDLADGRAPPANYAIQGKQYTIGYYLADGIYPKWSTLVQTIHDPQTPKKKYFAMRQESCRKDVERAFGVLQSRFQIVSGPARSWKKNVLHDIMTACIIMHNMIVEDERDLSAPIGAFLDVHPPTVEVAVDENQRFQDFLARHRKIKNREAHIALRNALIEHLWEEYSNAQN